MAQGLPAIVLVEDDDGLRNALAGFLVASGFEVVAFASAEAALRDEPWDVAACLVVDVRLPGISGLELLRTLPRRERRMPVIVITADVRKETRDAAMRLGASAYFEKPVHGRAIVAAVREAISK